MNNKQIESIKSQIWHEVTGYLGMMNIGIKDLAEQLGIDQKTLYNHLSGVNTRLLLAFDILQHFSEVITGDRVSFYERVIRKASEHRYKSQKISVSYGESKILDLYNQCDPDTKSKIQNKIKTNNTRVVVAELILILIDLKPKQLKDILLHLKINYKSRQK